MDGSSRAGAEAETEAAAAATATGMHTAAAFSPSATSSSLRPINTTVEAQGYDA